MENYTTIPNNSSVEDYIGQKVAIEGKISTIIMQHREISQNPFAPKPKPKKDFDVDEKYGWGHLQLQAFYNPQQADLSFMTGRKIRIYGKLEIEDGPQKSTKIEGLHREYFMNVEKVEECGE